MNAEQFDNELLNLSQKAANDSLAPFNEVAWQRMEQLLDADKKKRRFIIWWWLAPLLLVGAVTAIYLATKTPTIEITKIVQKNTDTKAPQTQAEQQLQVKDSNEKVMGATDKSSSVTTLENYTQKEKILTKTATTNNIQSALIEQKSQRISTKTKANFGADNRDIYTRDITKVQPKQELIKFNKLENIDKKIMVINDKAITKVDKITSSIIAVTPVDSVAKIDSLITKNTIEVKDSVIIGKLVSLIAPKKSFLSKFEFNAFVSSDITTIKFKNIDKVSTSIGVGVTYAISKKLSVSTGFAIGRKLYKADSVDYISMPLWSNPTYKLNNITANCLVYEVPLNLQYQFKQSDKNSWLAVVGLSNYYMISESYDYNYGDYGQTLKTNYLVKNKNNHLLSILNLGVAYRKQLSNKFSYQLTPYLKIPLTGIGAGKVNLYSAGLQLAINLRAK
jgi:hypothetical protein